MILSHLYLKKVKFYLIFFCALLILSCTEKEITYDLQFKDGKVSALIFDIDGPTAHYALFVKGNTETPVLGSFRQENGKKVFEPAISLASGQAYELKKGGKTVLNVLIPQPISKAPQVLAIYPTGDTVPENLLKMYFVFSKPMQEVGNMLDYIKVYNKTDAQEEDIFLSLENELWNAAHTQLTLWLDPGRIKRDLIPNKEKGLPIREGKEYEITIAAHLKDAQGVALAQKVSKTIYVTARDAARIHIEHWKLSTPQAASTEALYIDFNEPLDAILAVETVSLYTAQGNLIPGAFKLSHEDTQLIFRPTEKWNKGSYTITVDSFLEDLAGNTTQHLFDSTMDAYAKSEETAGLEQLVFTIN